MKKILLISLLIFSVSCSSEKEKFEKNTLMVIKQTIENEAFKQNYSSQIYTLNLLKMTKVSGHYININYLDDLLQEADRYNELAQLETKKMAGYEKVMNQFNVKSIVEKGTNSKLLIDEYLLKSETALETAEKVSKSIDSVKLDSIWKATVFVKATFKKEEDINNWLDTIVYVLNSNLEIQKFKQLD